MCTNFTPSSRLIIQQRFGLDAPAGEFKPEAFPGYLAPIIARIDPAQGNQCLAAGFGLLPHRAEDKLARHTYNARSETVAVKPAFRHAWQRRQFCLVPMAHFYEPSYASGRAQRWRIGRRDGADFAAAGLWECRQRDHAWHYSFTLLTINADGHPLMGQFHKPDEEKRSLVIIEPPHYQAWLGGEGDFAGLLSLAPLAGFNAAAASEDGQLALF
ncbi:SOS response-associated peptidase [Chitinimonas sp.]|uniref:SOS response-associated peptidase n=1 Tax=Chitinimonas sp. TaxID=1934313 RepID=UPI0035B2B2EF